MGYFKEKKEDKFLQEKFNVKKRGKGPVIALAGNPNTGKSTVFNALTGLKQHTGNWPGKTVLQAQGYFTYQGLEYKVVDLPGTYSLLANSAEEEVARDFIYFGNPHVTVVVSDATCLERNLNLVYQIMEITPKVILCLNLMDEAKRKKISINIEQLTRKLGIPVISTIAREEKGLEQLKETIAQMVKGEIITQPKLVSYDREIEEAIAAIVPKLADILGPRYNLRWLALRVLDGDGQILNYLEGQMI